MYELIFSQSACGGLTATLNFTVTAPSPPPPPPLPDLFTDKHLLSCTISMTDLAFDLTARPRPKARFKPLKMPFTF